MEDKMKELKREIGSVTRHSIKKNEERHCVGKKDVFQRMFQSSLSSNLVLRIKNRFQEP